MDKTPIKIYTDREPAIFHTPHNNFRQKLNLAQPLSPKNVNTPTPFKPKKIQIPEIFSPILSNKVNKNFQHRKINIDDDKENTENIESLDLCQRKDAATSTPILPKRNRIYNSLFVESPNESITRNEKVISIVKEKVQIGNISKEVDDNNKELLTKESVDTKSLKQNLRMKNIKNNLLVELKDSLRDKTESTNKGLHQIHPIQRPQSTFINLVPNIEDSHNSRIEKVVKVLDSNKKVLKMSNSFEELKARFEKIKNKAEKTIDKNILDKTGQQVEKEQHNVHNICESNKADISESDYNEYITCNVEQSLMSRTPVKKEILINMKLSEKRDIHLSKTNDELNAMSKSDLICFHTASNEQLLNSERKLADEKSETDLNSNKSYDLKNKTNDLSGIVLMTNKTNDKKFETAFDVIQNESNKKNNLLLTSKEGKVEKSNKKMSNHIINSNTKSTSKIPKYTFEKHNNNSNSNEIPKIFIRDEDIDRITFKLNLGSRRTLNSSNFESPKLNLSKKTSDEIFKKPSDVKSYNKSYSLKNKENGLSDREPRSKNDVTKLLGNSKSLSNNHSIKCRTEPKKVNGMKNVFNPRKIQSERKVEKNFILKNKEFIKVKEKRKFSSLDTESMETNTKEQNLKTCSKQGNKSPKSMIYPVQSMEQNNLYFGNSMTNKTPRSENLKRNIARKSDTKFPKRECLSLFNDFSGRKNRPPKSTKNLNSTYVLSNSSMIHHSQHYNMSSTSDFSITSSIPFDSKSNIHSPQSHLKSRNRNIIDSDCGLSISPISFDSSRALKSLNNQSNIQKSYSLIHVNFIDNNIKSKTRSLINFSSSHTSCPNSSLFLDSELSFSHPGFSSKNASTKNVEKLKSRINEIHKNKNLKQKVSLENNVEIKNSDIIAFISDNDKKNDNVDVSRNRNIREEDGNPHIKVVLNKSPTGHTDKVISLEEEITGEGHIQKKFNKEKLLKLTETVDKAENELINLSKLQDQIKNDMNKICNNSLKSNSNEPILLSWTPNNYSPSSLESFPKTEEKKVQRSELVKKIKSGQNYKIKKLSKNGVTHSRKTKRRTTLPTMLSVSKMVEMISWMCTKKTKSKFTILNKSSNGDTQVNQYARNSMGIERVLDSNTTKSMKELDHRLSNVENKLCSIESVTLEIKNMLHSMSNDRPSCNARGTIPTPPPPPPLPNYDNFPIRSVKTRSSMPETRRRRSNSPNSSTADARPAITVEDLRSVTLRRISKERKVESGHLN